MTIERTIPKVELTSECIEAINNARRELRKVSIYANSSDEGRIVALVDVAGDALFQLLNWASCFGVADITDEQLHLRKGSA